MILSYQILNNLYINPENNDYIFIYRILYG